MPSKRPAKKEDPPDGAPPILTSRRDARPPQARNPPPAAGDPFDDVEWQGGTRGPGAPVSALRDGGAAKPGRPLPEPSVPAGARSPGGKPRQPSPTALVLPPPLQADGAPLPAGLAVTKQEERQERKRAKREIADQKASGRDLDARLARHLAAVAGRAKSVGYVDRPVLEIPPLPAGATVVESHELVPGRALVRLYFDGESHTHVYQVVEPPMTKPETEILDFVRDTLLRTLETDDASRGPAHALETLVTGARQAILDHAIIIDEVGVQRVEYYLQRDFLGYGPVDVLMRDSMIEDISCDGPGIPIYLFHRKYESIRTSIVFPDDLSLDGFVIRLAQRSGKHISMAEPLLDATLPDGSRLQATLAREVTTRGSSFTVRKFRADPLTPPDLIGLGTLSAELAAYFWMVIENGHSFILAGGTASGKTTSLNAICQFIPPAKKIVSIEDTREINLSHDNWIAGLTRSGFGGELVGGKPAGTIDMYRLLEAALRQRPEYLLVGEVRGPEALTLFQAMATGHAVYSTMHADSVASAVYRLENPPISVPRIMLQTLDVVAIQTQQRVGGRMARRIREVVEIVGIEPGSMEMLTNTVFTWDAHRDTHKFLGKSHVFELISDRKNVSEEQVLAEWSRRVEILNWMVQQKVPNYREVANLISSYYRDPGALMERIHGGPPSHATL
ncbi:MAG: type II/IV secretion system ATPase subunit [Thermoplasmatota archaeon]